MAAVTIRNISDETHRALRPTAAHHGRSTEAEIREILEAAVRPSGRVKLGSLLASSGRDAELSNSDVEALQHHRDSPPRRTDHRRMILLDTYVISEPWKPAPDNAVPTWLDAQAFETLFISAISIAELRFGIASMPLGKRQTVLHGRLEGQVLPLLTGAFCPMT